MMKRSIVPSAVCAVALLSLVGCSTTPLTVPASSPPVESSPPESVPPASVPLREYLQGSWQCEFHDGFFVADGTATSRLDIDETGIDMWDPEFPERGGRIDYTIDGASLRMTAEEADFDVTLDLVETVTLGDEVPIVFSTGELTAEIVEDGMQFRDEYRVGIICDRL
jgi:hypothetical protein